MASVTTSVPARPRRGGPGASTRRVGRFLLALLLVLSGVLMLMPVVWVVLQSIELPEDQFNLPPVWFPSHVTLSSYRDLFSSTPFLLNILNSVLVTFSVVVGAAVISVLAAYVFARIEFRAREILFTVFLVALTIPTQVEAVPQFVVVKYMHLLNNQASLIIPAANPGVGDLHLAAALSDYTKGLGRRCNCRRRRPHPDHPACYDPDVVASDLGRHGHYRPVYLERFFLAQPFHYQSQPDDGPLSSLLPRVGIGRRSDRGHFCRSVFACGPGSYRVYLFATKVDGRDWLPGHFEIGSEGTGPGQKRRRPAARSPRIQVYLTWDGAPAGEPGNELASIIGTTKTVGDRGQDHGQFPRHVLLRPLRRLVAQAEVDMVYLHLPQPSHGACGRRPIIAATKLAVGPTTRYAPLPNLLQLLLGYPHV